MTIMQIFYTINYTMQQPTWNDSPSNHSGAINSVTQIFFATVYNSQTSICAVEHYSAILVGDHLQLYNLVMFSSFHHQFFFLRKRIFILNFQHHKQSITVHEPIFTTLVMLLSKQEQRKGELNYSICYQNGTRTSERKV